MGSNSKKNIGLLPINQEHENQEHAQNVPQWDRAMCAEDLFALVG
jgi:hypothetical protein